MPSKIPQMKFEADNPTAFNVIRAHSSVVYQDRIPIATQENFQRVAQMIFSYEPARNEFLHELYNRIGATLIKGKSYQNSLRMFKRGLMEYGDTVEEIYVNLVRAHQFNPEIAQKTVFKREIPDVSAMFHRRNYQNFYKQTIEFDSLKAAFLSRNGVQNLVGAIVDSMYTSAELDEFIIMKQLIVTAAQKGQMVPITVPAGRTRDDLLAVAAIIKSTSNMMEFMNNKYNAAGVITRTPKSKQYLIISAEFDAIFDVSVLSAAFNMDKAEFMGHKVLIDDLGILSQQGAVAALIDEDWFIVLDNELQFTENFNGEGLYWNYFYHVWKTFSTSLFANAVLFTTQSPTVTGVTVAPKTANVSRGGNVRLTATVNGTSNPSTAVEWILSDGVTDSYITSDGILYVGLFEKASSITVTAQSIYAPGQSDSATITIV